MGIIFLSKLMQFSDIVSLINTKEVASILRVFVCPEKYTHYEIRMRNFNFT